MKRLHHPNEAVLAHLGFIWQSVGFWTPGIDNLAAGSLIVSSDATINEACVRAQVKFFVPLQRPGRPQSVARIEIVSSINPIPVFTDSEVRRKNDPLAAICIVGTVSFRYSENSSPKQETETCATNGTIHTTGPNQHHLQAIDIDAWQTVKNALSVTQSSRKAALNILHESGSVEDVDISTGEHDCYTSGAGPCFRPSNTLLSHFSLLWRWMPFYTPNACNYPDVMAHWKERDPMYENARVKFCVPFLHPGQARAMARIEVHASVNPITAWEDEEVKAMVFEWVSFKSTTSRAFYDYHGTLSFLMEVAELRALLCWIET
ncbi:hypothetical protein TI39_contig395g00010 [Zymoseptoria brevis]|uniref:Thioesterase family protein n=1 Tax=Zymoseptoria brevis TaxID=1047168 RepID=A0A0F4GMR8_9PEZI|nr:hypothetical protein TI39_contig395g00010 [Zymoseptoria brevis]